MNLAKLSIARPIFVSCLALLLVGLGIMSFQKLPVDMFPNITFPVVVVYTAYPGAGPQEVETQVSKVFEDEFATISGLKRLTSVNREGMSVVVGEFSLETDVREAEQKIRDRASGAKFKLPDDVKEPVIRRVDPADSPVLIVSLSAAVSEAELFHLADAVIKPQLERVSNVGLVEVVGGRKREIHVELDRQKLKQSEISALMVHQRINAAGQNIPVGKDLGSAGEKETVYRTMGEFSAIKDVENVVVNFFGNDVPITVKDVGRVTDGFVDQKSQVFVNGKKGLFLMIFRQSGSNTLKVVGEVKKVIDDLNKNLPARYTETKLEVVTDFSKSINANVDDVKEAIIIGICLTFLVVFFFLGSGRSTLITGLAIPNSIIGAFFLMYVFGFSINVMTLLAISLAVGLLIDDAIVVRENIFRHQEMGKDAKTAALEGTQEVGLAVIATTLTVIAVFGPIGFLEGVVGQFFKEFGLTVCCAMAISLFDALTIAPMLSAYYAGNHHRKPSPWYDNSVGVLLRAFDRFQTFLENMYENAIRVSLRFPFSTLLVAFLIFLSSLYAVKFVPKTFLPEQDFGEFGVSLEMPPGTSLAQMSEVAKRADQILHQHAEVKNSVTIVGNRDVEPNKAEFFVILVDSKKRQLTTGQVKAKIREDLKQLSFAKPVVKDIDMVGGGQRPFNLAIQGQDMKELTEASTKVFEKFKNHPGLLDVEITHQEGKPEFQVVPDPKRALSLGVSTSTLGMELRTQIEGQVAAVFREKGEEYDIKVRLQEGQRDLKKFFDQTYVPNLNYSLVALKNVARGIEATGPATIEHMDRSRSVTIKADINPKGPGMAAVIADINQFFAQDLKDKKEISYAFIGQAENFQELVVNMIRAALFGILFIYLVLASLYESFVTPLTIMLVLPLATTGAFFALLLSGKSLDIFSMIGLIMLLGVATKNSILLVDYTNQLLAKGENIADALVKAGRARLRPILMTTLALIAGMLPIAIGLNEASKQRTSMGVAIIGGLISSTLLTLVVVPASYSYIERFRAFSLRMMKKLV